MKPVVCIFETMIWLAVTALVCNPYRMQFQIYTYMFVCMYAANDVTKPQWFCMMLVSVWKIQ
jgi:hypothetical protein